MNNHDRKLMNERIMDNAKTAEVDVNDMARDFLKMVVRPMTERIFQRTETDLIEVTVQDAIDNWKRKHIMGKMTKGFMPMFEVVIDEDAGKVTVVPVNAAARLFVHAINDIEPDIKKSAAYGKG
jgi:hypothetical protein